MSDRERVFLAGLATGIVLYPMMEMTFADPDWWMIPVWVTVVWCGFLALRWWLRPWNE